MIQKTLVLLKPDAIQRMLVGRIISRFEDTGLKIIGAKMVWVDKEFSKKHYHDIGERHGEEIMEKLVKYISSGPVLALCIQGVNAITNVRKIAGSTYPNEAPPGTIRGDFAHISREYADSFDDKTINNLIHASADEKDAEHEVNLWFKPEELHNYKTVHEHIVM